MNNDTLTDPTDDCLKEPDNVLDSARALQASRRNASMLRTMFVGCPTETKSAEEVEAKLKQNLQRLRPNSVLPTP